MIDALLGRPVAAGPGDGRSESRAMWSTIALVVVNIIPMVGLLANRLSAADVLLGYWAENLVLIGVTLVRLLTLGTEHGLTARLAAGGFFCVHFGFFTFMHLFFLRTFLVDEGDRLSLGWVPMFVVALVLSHGLSLWVHWFHGGERFRSDPKKVMAAPYARIVPIHFAIVLSGFFILTGDRGGAAAVILIVVKLFLDVRTHQREHRADERDDDDQRRVRSAADGRSPKRRGPAMWAPPKPGDRRS